MRLDNFDIRLLRVFMTIADCGGFSAAQAHLGLSQSAISNKMHDLETRMGLRLCERGRSGFRLTAEGERIYEETRILLGLIDQYEDRVGQIRHVLFGHVRIGIIDTLATNPECRLAESLRQFCHDFPQVNVSVTVIDSMDIESLLLQGRLDLGITSSEKDMPGLSYDRLFVERQCLYASPEHPVFALGKEVLDKGDVQAFAVAGRGQSHFITPLEAGFNTRAVSAHMEGTVFLLLSGEFIGYLPNHCAKVWVDQGRLRQLPAPALEYSPAFALTRPRYGIRSQAADRLSEAILASHFSHPLPDDDAAN